MGFLLELLTPAQIVQKQSQTMHKQVSVDISQ